MTGLLERIRGFFGRLLPGGSGGAESSGETGTDDGAPAASGAETAGGATAQAATEDAADFEYRCSVCGTDVRSPDGDCPLCGSSDVRHVADFEDRQEGDSAADRLDPSRARTTRVAEDAEDPAARLRRIREAEAEAESEAGTEGDG
ncbi:MAG: hypothetical protein ABEJ28_10370, partial [Salinigranum sp.]